MKKIKAPRIKSSEVAAGAKANPLVQSENKLVSHGKRFGFDIIFKQITSISKVTFHELIREKVLWSSFAFGIIAILLSIAVTQFSYVDNARIALDFGLGSIAIIGSLISIMMGSALISKEIQNRTYFIVLTKPVFRWQFIVGRWLGLLEVVVLNSLIMLTIMMVIYHFLDGRITFELVQGLGLIVIEFGVLSAIACIFSTFTTTTLSAIITIGIWLTGHAMEDFKIVSRKFDQEFVREGFTFLSNVLPDLTRFDIKMQISHLMPVSGYMVFSSALYGIAYMVFALTLSCLIFTKKEL